MPSSPRVVVIGAGAAGVFTAYLLQKQARGRFDITILEKDGAIGGNTRGHEFENQVHVDCGAQFFFESSEPDYCDMLRSEGLFDEPGLITETAVGMSVWNATAKQVEFAVPPDFEGILRGVAFHYRDWMNFLELTWAAIEKYFSGDWTETFGHWIDRVGFHGSAAEQAAFKKNIARPLMYQFGLVDPSGLDALSATFVVYYYVDSLPWPNRGRPPAGEHPPFAPFHLYTCSIGMDGILQRLLENYGLGVRTNSRVASIAPQGSGYVVTTADGTAFPADELVFATNPKWTLGLLPGTPHFADLRALLSGMPYVTVPVHVQDAPASPYLTSDPADWQVSNVTLVQGPDGQPSNYMLTVWFGPLKSEPVAKELWKSWGSPSLFPANQPAWVVQDHELMVGTPDFIARRDELRTRFQGVSSLWYAGGYLVDYDTQNSCLKSARLVAGQLIAKYGFPAADPSSLADVPPRIDPKNPPLLLRAIEDVLRTLDRRDDVLDAFKTRRR
jgi:predicted NAD/FAD-binding protein